MFTTLCLIALLALASQAQAVLPTQHEPMNLQKVLRAQLDRRPQWDDMLAKLDGQGRARVLGYTVGAGAMAGALAGLNTEMVSATRTGVCEPAIEMPVPGGMDLVYGAAAGAAFGGLLGASHIAFVESTISDTLRSDPKNPYRLRTHLFQLVPRIKTHGAALAVNASF